MFGKSRRKKGYKKYAAQKILGTPMEREEKSKIEGNDTRCFHYFATTTLPSSFGMA